MNSVNLRSYTCPCCGYLVFDEWPGSFTEICHICFWHDDPIQIIDPWFAGGANRPSLFESQQEYQRIGAKEERILKFVETPGPNDKKDPSWRPLDERDRQFVEQLEGKRIPERKKLSDWYYWLYQFAED